MKFFIVISLLFFSTISIAGSYSKKAYIGRLSFNASADKIYVYPNIETWVADGTCPKVYMTSNMPGYDKFVAMVLAAKLANQKVNFFGDCDSTTNQFNAHSIEFY